MSIPPLSTEQGTLIDYDLNIYHVEEEVSEGVWEYTDQWYLDIYEYLQTHTGSDLRHVTGPFPLTELERSALGLGGPDWDSDSWYGMWGFLKDYDAVITDRLRGILESLPKYVEDVLF